MGLQPIAHTAKLVQSYCSVMFSDFGVKDIWLALVHSGEEGLLLQVLAMCGRPQEEIGGRLGVNI